MFHLKKKWCPKNYPNPFFSAHFLPFFTHLWIAILGRYNPFLDTPLLPCTPSGWGSSTSCGGQKVSRHRKEVELFGQKSEALAKDEGINTEKGRGDGKKGMAQDFWRVGNTVWNVFFKGFAHPIFGGKTIHISCECLSKSKLQFQPCSLIRWQSHHQWPI